MSLKSYYSIFITKRPLVPFLTIFAGYIDACRKGAGNGIEEYPGAQGYA